MKVGLRIDVDTFRGMRDGVPKLCESLGRHGIKATFFFSVGPDNMGRHLRRLIRPAFLRKMLRTRASSLYGWDVLLRGTLWPGPLIGERLSHIVRFISEAGHEVGLHAWDHYAWQVHIDTMNSDALHRYLSKGVDSLTRALGFGPVSSAVPAWKCNDLVLLVKEKFRFVYNSDCRGQSIFLPLVNGKPLSQPQIPVTLPTYDEVIGSNGITDSNYNEYLCSQFKPKALNVLTIHAEAEGIACMAIFRRFLKMALSRGVSFRPLGALLADVSRLEHATIVPKSIPGREGWASCQVPC